MSDKFGNMTVEALQGFMDAWRGDVEALQDKVAALQAEARARQDDISQAATALERKLRQAEFERKQAEGRRWREENPEEHAAFLARIRAQNQQGLLMGAEAGWWDLDENGEMLAPAQVFRMADFAEVKNPTLGHVMHAAGLFPSVGQARKNGWDKTLQVGEWTVTKKRIRIRVVD